MPGAGAYRRGFWLLVLGAGVGVGVLALREPERFDAWRTFFVEPSHEAFPVRGIDVSHHQGSIDWQRVKASGQAFAFIKATEGVDFRDTRFTVNWQSARQHGLVTGAYHFFTFCSPGLEQADHFLTVAPVETQGLPLAVDVEFTGNCVGWASVEEIRHELRTFMQRVEERAGHAPLLYTTEDVRLELVPAELHAHRYWLRSLWGQPSADVDWRFWQYSDSGSVPGINGRVDLNVFSGSSAAWKSLLARTDLAPR